MKIPPKKPHFFKPIQPGFKHGLKIPIGFLKYLKGHDHIEHAILRTGDKKWMVKINGRLLEEGNWKDLVEELNLQLGDLLIFRHEGDMEFEVSIFDSSHLDREYTEFLQEEGGNNVEEYSKKLVVKEAGQSYFECTVTPYCISNGYLRLPKQFAMANGLINKKCGLIIRDERQRSWNLILGTHNSIVHILGGWGDFCIANNLKEGDYMMFEVVANGEKPIWKFHEKPKPKIKTSDEAFSNVEVAKDMHLSLTHFICTIKPYCFSKHCLCIPKKFAQENRLNDRNCMIIMRDEQRSWTLSVYTSGKNTFIGRGWREFCTTNCLKEGDCLVFEIVSNGETPIFRFHGLRHKTSDVTTPISQIPASTSADANPHFISTIKPYTITKAILYFPMDFVKSNGLMSRSEMILVDEKQRSWSVWLGKMERHFGIKRGWAQFRKANGVQVGDTCKFELTNNDTIPIVHFHCKHSGKDAQASQE
ncbi:hypothetical protein HAX54_005998 [Datura stramonium]|uniref:TF-B3 domain-containing protein n=1 Tax=Datura stramonium TaxID=4076 RepID=A0ABS8RK52_DATST|nr:hypothetical protein [Datura stramonium]